MQFKNCTSKNVAKHQVSLYDFLENYLEVEPNKELLSCRHRDLDNYHIDYLQRTSSGIVSFQDIIDDKILIVRDSRGLLAPYINPNVLKEEELNDKLYILEVAAKNYCLQNNIYEKTIITYEELKENDFVFKLDNPYTGEEINDDTIIIIDFINQNYDVKIKMNKNRKKVLKYDKY